MTMADPRTIPLPEFVEATIELDHGVVQAAHAGGLQVTSSQIRDEAWFGRFETPRLQPAEMKLWQAWHKTLRGGLKRFVAYDSIRQLPEAYWAAGMMPDHGGSPWDGIATVTSLATPRQIALSGVPVAYQATAGDRIGLEQTISSRDHYGYFEVVEDAVANGIGELSLSVEPLVQDAFTTAAIAKLYQPLCLFVIRRGSFQGSTRSDFPAVSFQATQVLF